MEKNQEDQAALNDLADLAFDGLNQAKSGFDELIDLYAQKLRMRFCENPELFREQFIEGYKHLLTLLRHSS